MQVHFLKKKKKKAIASLICLTEKRDGTIKASQCADGHTQRNHIDKEDAASPIVTTEAVF